SKLPPPPSAKPAQRPAFPTSRQPALASTSNRTPRRFPSPSSTQSSPSGSPIPTSGTFASRPAPPAPTPPSPTPASSNSNPPSAPPPRPVKSPSISRANGATL